jgi:hypothetical protein
LVGQFGLRNLEPNSTNIELPKLQGHYKKFKMALQ